MAKDKSEDDKRPNTGAEKYNVSKIDKNRSGRHDDGNEKGSGNKK